MSLPIEAESRAELWRLALPQLEPSQAAPLLVALARHCGQAAAAAAGTGQWGLCQGQLEEASAYYRQLRHGGQELSGLLAQLVVDAHQAVFAEQPLEEPERAALCWRAHQWLSLQHSLGSEPPDWLESLEEQLVREGGLLLRELAKAAEPERAVEQRRQALELLLHLGTLHEPVPEWIVLAQRELLEPEVALQPEQGAGPGQEGGGRGEAGGARCPLWLAGAGGHPLA